MKHSKFCLQYRSKLSDKSVLKRFFQVFCLFSTTMGLYIQLYFVYMFISNEIICRSIDSKTVPTIIDVANQSNDTMGNSLFSSTETAPISFDICENFDYNDEIEELQLRGHGITVMTKLF